jgi:surfeit locus protein 6
MEERERKRKREMEAEESTMNNSAASTNGTGPKKRKLENGGHSVEPNQPEASTRIDQSNDDSKSKTDKRKEKRERKREKSALQKVKDKNKQKRRREKFKTQRQADGNDELSAEGGSESGAEEAANVDDMDIIDATNLVEEQPELNHEISRDPSPTRESAISHASEQPPPSSTSSPPPTRSAAESQSIELSQKPSRLSQDNPAEPRPNHINIPKPDPEALKSRLQARIEALRLARKADGPDGRPARSRAELIETRRKKEEARKNHKKELRQAAKEEEQRAAAEAELARLRGSGSPMTNGSDLFSPSLGGSPSYSFGRIGFGDGSHLGANGGVVEPGKKRGAMDPRSALMAAEKKQERLGALDQAKREDIEEKDLWVNAKKKIHGEWVRDDVSLLKKTLQRKEKSKEKSSRDWKTREENIRKGKEAKQKKREDNLAKRREEKGNKGKKKSKNASKKKLKNKAFGNLK